MSAYTIHLPENACISLIGMPGAGKSTVGRHLARLLEWGLMDTDHLIEATYAAPLQSIADGMNKEKFLDLEGQVVESIIAQRTILSTGGSVVYRPKAMAHLLQLGPVFYLDVSLPLLLERIARNPNRGLAIAPGQSIEDIYQERQALYLSYAQHTVHADTLTPAQCSSAIIAALQEKPLTGL